MEGCCLALSIWRYHAVVHGGPDGTSVVLRTPSKMLLDSAVDAMCGKPEGMVRKGDRLVVSIHTRKEARKSFLVSNLARTIPQSSGATTVIEKRCHMEEGGGGGGKE